MIFNWAYDNNVLNIQNHLDTAGQYIDKVGEQINEGWNWAKDTVSDGLSYYSNYHDAQAAGLSGK